MRKFKYGEIALLDKGSFNTVRVGIKFDSKVVNTKRNKSGVSYYIEGYKLRNWCFEEELKKITIFHKLFFFFFLRKPESNN